MESIDEVREGAVVRIIAGERELKTRMNRTAVGETGSGVLFVSGHAGKEGKIVLRTREGNGKVEFGGGDSCLFPWDALMVHASPSQARPLGDAGPLPRQTCLNCQKTFGSRNQLFKHLASTHALEEAKCKEKLTQEEAKRKQEEKRKQEAAAKETLVVGVDVCFD